MNSKGNIVAGKVLSKRIWPNIKPPIRISISIILIDPPRFRINILPDIESPAYFCNGNENGVCREMFARTDTSAPAKRGGCFFGGGEWLCVAEFGVVEEAAGLEGMWVGIIDFGMIYRPSQSQILQVMEEWWWYHKFPRMVVPLGMR